MLRTPLVLAVALSFAPACTDEANDPFGDRGTPSANAAELLGKNDGLVNDKIAGVYEAKGEVSGQYPSGGQVYRVTNKYVKRTELRKTMLVTVLKCDLTSNEPSRAPVTLTAFVAQAAVGDERIYSVKAAGMDKKTDALFMTDCALDQPATNWAYCEETIGGSGIFTDLPEGAQACVGRWDLELRLVEAPSGFGDHGELMGTKVAN
jgi:hypothetical protein